MRHLFEIWWVPYVISLGAYIFFPVALGRRWWNKLFGAIAMIGLWCLIVFTPDGRLAACYYDPYQQGPCYLQPPQRHIPPPDHWWRTH
jgi:hypothetical protein